MSHKKQTISELPEQIARMRKDGYKVFPSQFLGDGRDLYDKYGVLNAADQLSATTQVNGTSMNCADGAARPNISPALFGGYTSSGIEMPVENCGSPKKGYITWGSNNQLPNFISIANSMLVYTATCLKFNVDTACGLGVRPMYRLYSGVAGRDAETEIPFEHAGLMIRKRILAVQKEMMNLLAEKENVTSQDETIDKSPSEELSIYLPSLPEEHESEPEQDNEEKKYPHREAKASYYKAMSCDMLDEIIQTYRSELADLKKNFGIWKKTEKSLRRFMKRTNTTLLNHHLFNDLLSYGICFPEVRLSQNAGKQANNSNWKPTVESLGRRDALTCRLERMDENNVSRYVYVSNAWLTASLAPANSTQKDMSIDAIPAIDPMSPSEDLNNSIRQFRISSARNPSEDKNVSLRPTRFIMPIAYNTPGRPYYPIPSYWSIFNDIYQFASNIIRDRRIRKDNENMFGYVVYVHADYLDRLVNQVNAQQTDKEKNDIKKKEIQKIKQFLSDKKNNGQSFAACTFTGSDGKDHDAFRIEQVSMANKSAAEADKTEIADISSIILFAQECHPDLIGSTPGGASSSGGTYQREMLSIKQAKMAQMQNLLLEVYNLVRDINEWDEHLTWHITQRTLTTLDRSHSGTVDE